MLFGSHRGDGVRNLSLDLLNRDILEGFACTEERGEVLLSLGFQSLEPEEIGRRDDCRDWDAIFLNEDSCVLAANRGQQSAPLFASLSRSDDL